VHRLWRLHRVMELSLACTLANKHNSTLSRVYRKVQTTLKTPHGTHKVLEVTVPRGAGKKPRVAWGGGIALRWQKTATLHDRPKEGDSYRSEIAQRLLAQHWEVCGAEEDCEVPHIRKLADLDKPGRKDKPPGVKRMARRKRKTWVVCRPCHEAMHYGEPKRHKSVAESTGELREIERLLRSAEGGGWKSSPRGEDARWPPTLLSVRFGGGPGEKAVMTSLAVYPTSCAAAALGAAHHGRSALCYSLPIRKYILSRCSLPCVWSVSV
jgi:hypothetical protein